MEKEKKFIRYIITAVIFAVVLSVTTCAVTVLIDPGHGGMDGGCDKGVRTEKEYNLIIGKYLAEELSGRGISVYLTRSDDTGMKILPRALGIIEHNADILISLHCNSNDQSTKVNGSVAYVSCVDKYNTSELAGAILDKISGSVKLARGTVRVEQDTGDELGVYYWDYDRQWDMPGASQLGVLSDYYSINTWSSKFGVPSIIIEHGYLSNPDDSAVLDKDENLKSIARAEAEAIIGYYTGHTHQWSAEKVTDFPSSCVMNGTRSYRCSVCGIKSETEALAPAAENHFWRQTGSKKPTCTEDGYTDYVCQISYNLSDRGYSCEVHEYRQTAAATGHSYTVTEDTPAAHGKDGRLVRKCSVCGDTVEEIRAGEPHKYVVASSREPDCTEDGEVVTVCDICKDTVTEVKPALGHSYTETERLEKTDTEDGYIKYVCEVCGDEKTEIIFACDHSLVVSEELPATCTENGRVRSVCSKCGYEHTEEIKAAGHSMTVMMDVPASCEKEGYYRAECSVCGYKDNKNYPPSGHSFETVEADDTHTVKVCRLCGATVEEELPRRSLITIFENPVTAVILAAVIIQIVAICAILIFNRRHKSTRFTRTRVRGKGKTEKTDKYDEDELYEVDEVRDSDKLR